MSPSPDTSESGVSDFIRSRTALEDENKRLQKLLESTLPKHLVSMLRNDLMIPSSPGWNNFHKFYLDYHESISILFADIVEFTKITELVPSSDELVAMLSELFGRFDKVADANKCIRIKILGDCYFCVSGIPENENEPGLHAKQCVQMGLDMIEILAELSQNWPALSNDANDGKRNHLNMRIGIHTGQAQCGIIGKKRWQFDVYSSAAMLASRLEQSSLPGRIHISEETRRQIDGDYEVELAQGIKHDALIADKNIETYFVKMSDRRQREPSLELDVIVAPLLKHFMGSVDYPFANLDPGSNVANITEIDCNDNDETLMHPMNDVNKCSLRFKDPDMSLLYNEKTSFRKYYQMLCSKFKQRIIVSLMTMIITLPLLLVLSLMKVSHSSMGKNIAQIEFLEANQSILIALLALIGSFMAVFLIYCLHQAELKLRIEFLLHQNAIKNQARLAQIRRCNKYILDNILPHDVAEYFLASMDPHPGIYSRSHEAVNVSFVTICGFNEFYNEKEVNNYGRGCLKLLNEIFCAFDGLLNRDQFKSIDKIKHNFATYMLASGLCHKSSDNLSSRRELAQQLRTMLEFLMAMRKCLDKINSNTFSAYKLRAGLNCGPVTAGVIDTNKLHYDIWGNTVNVASRMESTCEPNMIQVTEDVYMILKQSFCDIKFKSRGLVHIKGKGEMATFYVEMPNKAPSNELIKHGFNNDNDDSDNNAAFSLESPV